MKVGLFTDLHLGIKQDSAEWHAIALEWADWFVSELKERDINTVFFLGDFFHNRSTVSVITLYTAFQFIQKLADFDCHFIFGNHDLYYQNNPEVSGVALFDGFKNIHIYNKPEVVELGGKKLVFSGWGYDPLKYEGDVLLTHAEIDVFKFNDGIICNSGLKPSSLLKNYKKIISGHFHARQIKNYKAGSIEYIGNPFQTDFSDTEIDKVFAILDLDDLSMDYVQNRISPRFRRKELSELVELTDLQDFVNELQGNYLKLVINKDITVVDANELKRLLYQFNPKDVKFDWIDKEQFVLKDKEIKTFDLSDAIREYIDGIEIDSKEEIKNYVLDLFKKHNNL